MINFNYDPTEAELDSIKLAVIKLLFDDDFRIYNEEFQNCANGCKKISFVLEPKED